MRRSADAVRVLQERVWPALRTRQIYSLVADGRPHYAVDNDLTLRAAALKLGFVTEAEFDRVVDPTKMVKPYVATSR